MKPFRLILAHIILLPVYAFAACLFCVALPLFMALGAIKLISAGFDWAGNVVFGESNVKWAADVIAKEMHIKLKNKQMENFVNKANGARARNNKGT